MTRILFSADGSSGDLLPMVLMAQEFKRAGYEVCVCGSSDFAKMGEDFAVPYESYHHSYSKIYLDQQRTGYIHNIRGNITHQTKLYQDEFELLSKIAPQFDVLINFLGELFTPSIAEAFDLINIKLFTFPLVESVRYAPPTGLPFITESRWINTLHWRTAQVAAHLVPYYRELNRLRAQLDLPPIRSLLRHNSRCDHMMIGLYQELMPPCKAWRSIDYSYIGPCLPKIQVPLSDELESFLARGPKPVYIGFGSMRHADGDGLTRKLLQAVRDAGVRAILARSGSTLGNGMGESEDVFLLEEYPIPHHILFPRLKAAVHHGSWITTHLAARAGIPQLVLAQASDQYLWADRITKSGLGPRRVDMNRLNVKKLSAAIEQLTGREEFERNARALAERVAGIDGSKNAVALFESLYGRLPPGMGMG